MQYKGQVGEEGSAICFRHTKFEMPVGCLDRIFITYSKIYLCYNNDIFNRTCVTSGLEKL